MTSVEKETELSARPSYSRRKTPWEAGNHIYKCYCQSEYSSSFAFCSCHQHRERSGSLKALRYLCGESTWRGVRVFEYSLPCRLRRPLLIRPLIVYLKPPEHPPVLLSLSTTPTLVFDSSNLYHVAINQHDRNMSSPILTESSPAQAGTGQAIPPPSSPAATSPQKKKKPHPFWLGGVAATIAASITQ